MIPELFVVDEIKKNNFSMVPTSMAIGDVYKLSCCGDLAVEGFEFGFLYLPKGSGIRKHPHTNDIERYQLISGVLRVDGVEVEENICLLGKEHNIDIVEVDTIIATTKVNKTYLEGITTPITSKFFDYFYSLDKLSRKKASVFHKKI